MIFDRQQYLLKRASYILLMTAEVMKYNILKKDKQYSFLQLSGDRGWILIFTNSGHRKAIYGITSRPLGRLITEPKGPDISEDSRNFSSSDMLFR